MSCDGTLDSKVNRIHQRALLITYKDIKSDFDQMLLRDNAVPINHIRNLHLLMIEIYITEWELNPTFMKDIFIEKKDVFMKDIFIEKHSTYGLSSIMKYLLMYIII